MIYYVCWDTPLYQFIAILFKRTKILIHSCTPSLYTRVNIDLVELQYIKKRLKSAQRSLGWAVALIQRLLIYTKINLLSHKGTPAQFTELSATECSVPYFGKILQIGLHFRLQFLVWKLTK